MAFHLLAIALLSFGARPAAAAAADCSLFLVGSWTGKGAVTGFGPPVQVDNAYTYNKDGSFKTINRFLGQDKHWIEQTLSGTWRSTPGRSPRECVLVLKSVGPAMTASSTSHIRMIDKDTFRSLGFDMKRVVPPAAANAVGSRD